MIGWRPLLGALVLLIAGCSAGPEGLSPSDRGDARQSIEKTDPSANLSPVETTLETATEAGSTASDSGQEAAEPRSVAGTVVAATTGRPLGGARVSLGIETVLTTTDGSFELTVATTAGDGPDRGSPTREGRPPPSTMLVERSAWQRVEVALPSDDGPIDIELEPLIVRGIRVSGDVAADPVRWRDLLELAENSSVNTLVFDTKDEDATVLYDTDVTFAKRLGAVEPVYDPERLIAQAKAKGLYTITRVVTFEDSIWADGDADARLNGSWVNAANPENWRYPIDLAVEACQLGFDEVQFDYVRFPPDRIDQGEVGAVPQTGELRTKVIADFLATARAELLAEGCGISAAVFGIVMSSETDEQLGQTPETVSAVVDAVSPMLYPSHYSPGWLGFDDPNEHPGPVIAFALDEGSSRMDSGAAMRPWIQGFFYSGEQIKAQIDEAEARGAGWIIWNAGGNYRADWLPPRSPSG